MIKGTTPTHTFHIPVSAEEVKKVKITYKQCGITVLTKREDECEIVDYAVSVRLTQEDTFKFNENELVCLQIRVITQNDEALACEPFYRDLFGCLDTEVL